MKQFSFLILTSFIPIAVMGQKLSTEIEIFPYIRMDWYPQFSYVINGRPSTDYIKIKGTSFGLNVAYKIPINKSVLFTPGIGYYKYSFNNIKRENTQFGKSKERHINFVSPLYIPFFSNKYKYNTICANIGVEKIFKCNRNVQIISGLNLNSFYVVSEYYHLANNPGGSNDYLKEYKRYFGSSFNLKVSVIKKYKRISMGPSIILPLFDIWKKDNTFSRGSKFRIKN